MNNIFIHGTRHFNKRSSKGTESLLFVVVLYKCYVK